MPRGRLPKPTKLKLLTGNPGKRPLNLRAPPPNAAPPRCPVWLDAEAKRKWKRLAPELARLGLLTLVDGDALAAYCQAWAEFRQATEALKQEGRLVTKPSGRRSPHPAVAPQRSARRARKDFAGLFGLDPSSRSKLHAGSPEADELEEFLGRPNPAPPSD
jgi:P27 family predicted phage terminase small subunit